MLCKVFVCYSVDLSVAICYCIKHYLHLTARAWLQDMRNPRLRENVLLGIIEPSRLAVMTPHEMASDDMKELRAKFTKEAIDDYQMAKQGGTSSDLFKCSRCGRRDTTYNQVCQTTCSFVLRYLILGDATLSRVTSAEAVLCQSSAR